MKSFRRLRVVTAACATAALAGALAFAAAGNASSPDAPSASPAPDDCTCLDIPSAAVGIAFNQKAYSPNGPIVTELSDGRFVQRTPGENVTPSYDAEGAYSHPAKNVLYNCAYLKAERGTTPRGVGRR